MTPIQGINAILAGDYPDPSIVRAGEHYYMTHSSFHYTPGLLIWHSLNLTDWEPAGHAVLEHVGGPIMAPDFIYHEGLFYIYFPAGGTNWVVTAENPAGPWSRPVDLKVGYIDPGHAADEQGNRYLFLSEGYRIRLSKDGLSTAGELELVYTGWRYPKEWLTEGFYLESPKLTYKDGYYYMTSAQGGTAGPATSHMIVSARAASLDGPWENSPHNPVIRTQHRSEQWWSKGHGTLVDTPEGDWYLVYHAYEKDYYPLGRQTLLEPVTWTADGWFTAGDQEAGAASASGLLSAERQPDRALVSEESGGLGLHWHFWGGVHREDYRIDKNSVVLKAVTGEQPGPLLCIPVHHTYTAEVTIAVGDGAYGTLGLFYKPGFHYGIGFDGREAFAYRNGNASERSAASGGSVTLRLINDEHEVSLYFMNAKGEWSKLDHGFEMSGFHHNVLGGFLSLRIALQASGAGEVRFSGFKYRAGL
ncbi:MULTISPECIES: family 43 glycosylhydrolase [unclassified Paenibacillus]|uniref:family 43 glycosylhydrolase n=1 Tax=unclassified Paenibacillus TaxID=185978 RepID=UPI002405D523|nr:MULTISPECIES: family 43 glycosylhydrolase [unclassified Paenibacillus]MDF9844383.1 xylan 1,4-beta-xylosidase [Paenibacillus sp. PastF-2]MDF9850987.1 xylan 1,4-beta-xylosidase [Paenibacillus sp. PastM-2]MDF9857558.1 xylan 1,4-beta-xylosidase [Paenibacillus sp. PastF-1]MDH6482801.1 xylan 1,4-beta-xylosidase [Paenibacillus sp. PastH-2]MDH6510227.1 xylan 1,4-beta-xylosidase [Paenibacillus sp. PastM-3]